MVRIRQRVLATMRLDKVFAQGGRHTPAPAALADGIPIAQTWCPVPAAFSSLVIVGERGHDVGLMVNRVLGQEDVVIQSLAENYRNVPGIAGATILGDGRVALILDIPALMGLMA